MFCADMSPEVCAAHCGGEAGEEVNNMYVCTVVTAGTFALFLRGHNKKKENIAYI